MLIAGNWKMYKGPVEAREFCARLRARLYGLEGVDVIVCPPYPSLHDCCGILANTEIAVFAQNAHWAQEGPWTGEISMRMAKDAGATLIEIGHSERREHFGETDRTVALKAAAAVAHGLTQHRPFSRC